MILDDILSMLWKFKVSKALTHILFGTLRKSVLPHKLHECMFSPNKYLRYPSHAALGHANSGITINVQSCSYLEAESS